MDRKTLFLVVAILQQLVTILCDDIEDCERCSTQNLFLENISTESTAKRCWILRTHFIRYCDMCLRRCCASDDLEDHNPVCASTEPNWHRHYHGRRVFYNDCAFFKHFCENEQPGRSLLWRCMFRRHWDHSDCDASSAHFDNGRRKPRLHVEKYPPKIKCERFTNLPELSPCETKKVTPLLTTKVPTTLSRPPPTTMTTAVPTTESPEVATTDAPVETTNEPRVPATPPTTIKLITDVQTTQDRTPKLPLPIDVSVKPTKHAQGRIATPQSLPAPTSKPSEQTSTTSGVTKILKTDPQILDTPPRTTQPNVEGTKSVTELKATTTISTKPIDDGTQPSYSRPITELKDTTKKVEISTKSSVEKTDAARTSTATQMMYTTPDNNATEKKQPELLSCSCKNTSQCNITVKTKVQTDCHSLDSHLPNCQLCYGKFPPKFPLCSFPQIRTAR